MLGNLDAIRDRLTKDLERHKARNQLSRYLPYAKQLEFHQNGRTARERLLMAANRVGKTFCGAAEMAMHLTGRYPDWWLGRRFSGPIEAWAGSDTGETTRDTVQTNLIGPAATASEWGTGAIPADALGRTTRRMGVADALDTVEVKHISGSSSLLGFKSYDQGRKKWQGTAKHVVWLDEEPPMDIYMEALTRTTTVQDGGVPDMGLIYLTFTPLLGMSEVVRMFLHDGEKQPEGERTFGNGPLNSGFAGV